MKHLLPVVIFLFLAAQSGYSQYLSSKDSDPEAIKMLENACRTFKSSSSQVNFILKISYPGSEPVTHKGVLFQSGKSYHLDLEEYSIMSDGTTRWVYFKGPNEVNIYNESNGQDWISPQDFLQLHTSTELVFILAGTRSDGISIVEAKPLEGRFESYSKFILGIKNNVLSFIHALSKDGTRQELSITSIAHPSTLDAKNLFTFRPELHPGVYVEDLRLD